MATNIDLCRKRIRNKQIKEFWYIGFFILYVYYYILYGDENPFDVEIEYNCSKHYYPNLRKPFAWKKYL